MNYISMCSSKLEKRKVTIDCVTLAKKQQRLMGSGGNPWLGPIIGWPNLSWEPQKLPVWQIRMIMGTKSEGRANIMPFICGIFKKWYKQTYSQNRNTLTHLENKHGYRLEVKDWGEGQIGSLGLMCTHWCI